jgi:hypothetical protein
VIGFQHAGRVSFLAVVHPPRVPIPRPWKGRVVLSILRARKPDTPEVFVCWICNKRPAQDGFTQCRSCGQKIADTAHRQASACWRWL